MEQKSMTDHDDNPDQDCYRDANRYVERIINVSSLLTTATSEEDAKIKLLLAQKQHTVLFETFMAGVRCAREK